jgi:hypothetical protein
MYYKIMTQRVRKHQNKKTRKNISSDGWITVKVAGSPYEMGYQHGRILRKQIEKAREVMKYMVKTFYKTSLSEYVSKCVHFVKETDEWKNIFDELRGIRDGCSSAMSLNELIAWNMYLSMDEIYGRITGSVASSVASLDQRCSAFIATGSKTVDGKILMAHNTHCDYASGFISNIVMHMAPSAPGSYPFVMQTLPGLVSSSTDWFISESGIIGCETTISDINYIPDFEKGAPFFFRIRKAMETGKTLDDYVSIMTEQNAGDYACSWLFGDINSGEIMRFELGKETRGIDRTKDGLFYGMNSAFSKELVIEETNDTGLNDPNSGTGSRNFRLNHLLNLQKLDLKYAKKVLADHYDHGENKFRKGMRGICKHKECESGDDYKAAGTVDGKVTDATMARKMKFVGRMGSSCGRVFLRKDYPDVPDCIDNMPRYKWVTL